MSSFAKSVFALVIGALFSASAPAFAEEAGFELEYLDGEMNAREGSGWRSLEMGAQLALDDIVRLEPSATAVLTGPSLRIILKKPGVWKISHLLAEWKPFEGAQEMISQRLVKLLGGYDKPKTEATLGVRSAGPPKPAESDLGTKTDAVIAAALEQVREGRIADAEIRLEEALDLVPTVEESKILFYLAYVRDLMKDKPKALATLEEGAFRPDDPFFSSAALLKARLLLDTGAAEEAADWVDSVVGLIKETEVRQGLWLIRALAAEALGHEAARQEAFAEIIRIDPYSEVGLLAGRWN